MRFAFVTDELPRAGVAGHLAFNEAVIGWLRGQGHEVVVLLVRPRLRLPVEYYGNVPVSGPGIVNWRGYVASVMPRDVIAILARLVLRKLPTNWAFKLRRRGRESKYGAVDAIIGIFTTPAQAEWCQTHIAALQPDAVIVDTIFRAPILNSSILACFNSVILTHDLFHIRHRVLVSAGYKVFPAELSRAQEADFLNKARNVAAIQTEEAALIRDMCPSKHVIVTPMPAIPCPRPPSVSREPGRLVFVGGDSLPNLDGLRWFFSEIWPRLQYGPVPISLDLVGDCGAALGELPSGVNRLGRVENLGAILHRAQVAVAPLRVGSGLKIKLLDYARHGLFTIATPASLQGFTKDPSAPFLAAESPVAFSVAVLNYMKCTVLKEHEAEALKYIENHYGFSNSFFHLAQALELPTQINTAHIH